MLYDPFIKAVWFSFWSLQELLKAADWRNSVGTLRLGVEWSMRTSFEGAVVHPGQSPPLLCPTRAARPYPLATLAVELLLNPPYLSQPSSNVPSSWQPPPRPQEVSR